MLHIFPASTDISNTVNFVQGGRWQLFDGELMPIPRREMSPGTVHCPSPPGVALALPCTLLPTFLYASFPVSVYSPVQDQLGPVHLLVPQDS